ncbi:helix-turn-helix transcriptional regulator [Mediterraneibacter sp. ICN-202921]|jgi:predicted transcriptional regulator YheO|uniref:helix-turn-helix transcriptional regulator n=1 Tax=Mediterraneibacter sp. ICN-202921 TaxID=3134657 RepID=UPI0030BD0940
MANRLTLLKQLAHGLAVQFGTSCEIVIHDLNQEDLNRSIVYIENGHVSNRQEGDGPSGIVLEALKSDPDKIQDKLSYLTKTEDGRILKSSTMYIRGEDHTISYIFSLNYDITPLIAAQAAVQPLIQTEAEKRTDGNEEDAPATITHNVSELLDQLIEQATALVGKPVALMNKDDKIKVVQYLNDAGAFLITKSGDKVSSFLGISKFTLYSYMDAGK